jgi:hypothetical protein
MSVGYSVQSIYLFNVMIILIRRDFRVSSLYDRINKTSILFNLHIIAFLIK